MELYDMSSRGESKRPPVKVDYDIFIQCYKEWCEGKINLTEFGKRCGVSYQTISNRIKYMYNHHFICPPNWFFDGDKLAEKHDKERENNERKQ